MYKKCSFFKFRSCPLSDYFELLLICYRVDECLFWFCVGGQVPVFISPNPDFRLPQDNSVPIIMVGPGTGISPFRAFIQERGVAEPLIHIAFSSLVFILIAIVESESGCGTNLLYFGCRHKNRDYLYKEELGR